MRVSEWVIMWRKIDKMWVGRAIAGGLLRLCPLLSICRYCGVRGLSLAPGDGQGRR